MSRCIVQEMNTLRRLTLRAFGIAEIERHLLSVLGMMVGGGGVQNHHGGRWLVSLKFCVFRCDVGLIVIFLCAEGNAFSDRHVDRVFASVANEGGGNIFEFALHVQ